MHRLLWGAAVAFALLVVTPHLSSTAHAQAADGSDQEARALFAAGQVAFDDGRYENALEYFQRAYDLSHRPLLLYNIGSSAEHLRLDQRALDAYRGYIAAVPEAGNRAAVEARISVLERAVATTTTTTTDTTTTTTPDTTTTTTTTDTTTQAEPPPATHADSGPGVAPWIVLGIGAAVAIAGGVLVGVGMSDIGTVTNAAQGSHWSDVRGAYGDAPALTGAGWVCLGVGAAAVIGGLVWGLVGGGSSDTPTASAWIDGSSGGAVVSGSF